MRLRSRWVWACAVLASCRPPRRESRAQGFLVDRRPNVHVAGTFEVREVALDARIRDQVAEVQVSQTFHNPGSFQLESEYLFPLPEDGAVQNFVLLVDGKELPGRLMAKDEARRIYEEIVRTKRDPALLEYMGRGLYRTSVFPIPPGADRKVTMRYTQVCKRDRDVVEFAYPFGTQKFTAKPIQTLSLTVRVESRDAIKSVYCPTYDADVRRSGDHEARVSLEQHDVVPDGRLPPDLHPLRRGLRRLGPELPADRLGGRLLPAAGQPRVKADDVKPQPKTVIFVLDRSGLDGRQEDRAGAERPEVRPRQPPRRRHVQHRRLRRPRRDLPARASALLARAPARRPSGSSRTSAKGAAPTSTPRSRPPSA